MAAIKFPGEYSASAPLLSWDIFMEGYRRTMQLAEDKMALEKLCAKQKWQHEFDFEEQIFAMGKTILVTSPALRIVYATSNIYQMNRYMPKDVLGQSPAMFQGKDTSLKTRSLISKAITLKQPFETNIINYRKDGEIYNCHIKGYPLFNNSKQLVNFIAFENVA